MKPYTKTYLSFFGYDESDTILCEYCSAVGVDLHHINARGMGGSKTKDNIENIMCLCRDCHNEYGDKKQHKEHLQQIHNSHIAQRKEQIKKFNTPDKPNLDTLF